MSGDPWTPQMVQDIKSFTQAQAQVAHDTLGRGIDNTNKLYGTNVGTALKQQSSSGTGALSVTAPNGKTYSFKDQASLDAFKLKAGIN
jgi:hypothetical protein